MFKGAGYLAILVSISGCNNILAQKRADVFLQNEKALPGKIASLPAQLRNAYIKDGVGAYLVAQNQDQMLRCLILLS